MALSSYTVILPIVDSDGNPLSDGLGCSVVFDVDVTTFTVTGPLQIPAPPSISAGQVLKFSYSVHSGTWWPA